MNLVKQSTPGASASRVLVLRVILLLAAGALVAAGFMVASRGGASRGGSTDKTAEPRFGCPMHPEVKRASPGQCPICKMALEPSDASKREIPVAPVAAGKPEAPRAQGTPVPVIPPPDPMYGPGKLWLPETFPAAFPTKPGDRPAIGSPRREVFVDDVRAAAWLDTPDRLVVVLYQDELIGLLPGDRATFFRAEAPNDPIEVSRSDAPPEPWDDSTSLVRFAVGPRGAAAPAFRPGDVGWLEMKSRSRQLVGFPESALLRSSEGPFVLVASADGHTFTRRRVKIGRTLQGRVVVLSGLTEADRVVIGNAFFLDVEQRHQAEGEPGTGAAL